MTRQRVETLILALLMALILVAPEFSPAFAEGEAPAPTESATQAPAPSAPAKKAKQFKVKFVDPVAGKAIGDTQHVNAGEAASAPDAPDHSDLGFQFAGWDKDYSAVKKNLTVTAQYASVHQIALGDFETAKAAPGGKLHLALPVVFKNALTGGQAASNTLANGKESGYDAALQIPGFQQGALAQLGLEWVRIDLDLSGTPLKAAKSDRSSYILKSAKDSSNKYGVPNGQPVNRGFAVFDSVTAKAGAGSGTYALKGAIVWRLQGTELDNKAPFEIKLKIGGAPETKEAALPGETVQPGETQQPDDSNILIANQGPKATPEVQILGSAPTPEPTATPEPTVTPEATATVEPTITPEATETAEPTVTPDATATVEPTVTPDATATVEPTVTPEATETAEPTATPDVTVNAEPTATPDATVNAEPTATLDPALNALAVALPTDMSEVTAEPSATPDATATAEPSATPDMAAAGAITAKGTGEEGDTTTEAPAAKSYTVTFVDYDGSTITTSTVQAGYTPSAPGDYISGKQPVKKIDGTWSVFENWHPDLAAVTQDISIGAHYEALTDPVQTTYVDKFDGATYTDQATAEAAAATHLSLGYKFTGWDEEAALGAGVVNVTATTHYEMTSIFAVCPRSFASGKPKGALALALPVSYQLDKNAVPVYSDTLADTNKRAEKYTGKQTFASFDQNVQDVYLQLDAFGGDVPLTAAGLPPAYVVQGGVNNGYAVFDGITVKSSATNGFYTLTGKLYWKMTGQKDFSSMTFTTQVRVTGAHSSSGGSSYGGGGSTTGPDKPQAKLVVEAITTDPLDPKAGQNFDVVLSLKNTSPDYYVQNIGVTYTTEADALMPTSGSNTTYISKIDKSESYELRLPVKSNPELADENVKIDLALDYEDKKLTALTGAQSVMVKVEQVQRMQLDQLQLPATQPTAGDSVQLTLGIFNLGRTALNNVTAKVVCDNPNLSPGQAFFGGNMDPGTSKTAELDVTPIEAGEYSGNVEVTYENAGGDVTTEKRPFTLNAAALEDLNYGDTGSDLDTATPAPEAPSAAQIMQFLPAWLYAAVGLVLLLIVLAIAMSARRRRRRMFEDDEMD